MIRVKIAVALLKWAGTLVEYRVRRLKPKAGSSRGLVDGTTLFRSPILKEAQAKFHRYDLRAGEIVAIQIVARVKERASLIEWSIEHATDSVTAGGAAEVPTVEAAGDTEHENEPHA